MDDPYMVKRPLSLNISKPAAVVTTTVTAPKPQVFDNDSDSDSSLGSQKDTKRIKTEQKIEKLPVAQTPRVIEVSQTHDS